MTYNEFKEGNWLNDCLEGRYKGLEKAARIYEVSLRQPMYFRLVILELMENLTSGNEELRRNSLWMLTKLVEEHIDYKFMSPTIQILIHSIQEKNNAICYYSLRIINEIAPAYFQDFKEAIPKIVENLNRSSPRIKLVAASIITQYMEAEPNAMQSAIKFLVEALKDKDLEIREVAIKALLRGNRYVDQVVEAIIESFQDEQFRIKMTKYIFDFIKREPIKVIEGLCQTIKNKDEEIRQNSIIFMHQIALSKHIYELVKAVPELLKLMTDKNRIIHRTAMMILYLISKQHAQSLHEGFKKFIQFLKIKNKQLLTYDLYILVQLLKYYPDELAEHVDPLINILEKSREWDDVTPEIEIINTISLCSLLRYTNQMARALNLAQECARVYGLEKLIYEIHLFTGFTHYYLGNYSDSIQAFLKAESAHKRGDFYTGTIANIMIAFNFALLRVFKSCLDYKNDAEKIFESAKDQISLHQTQELQFLMDFINALANQNFDKAQTALQSYHALDPVKHTVDQNFHLIDLKNIRQVKKFYIESQEILAELKRQNPSEEEPQILSDGKKGKTDLS